MFEEVDLSLTTPVIRDEDSVFPGENWFFYWKTSASLWRVKLESLTGVKRILVPINWAFHSDTGEKYDFAEEKPETDLKKLVTIADECGIEVVFLVPMTPCPFLTNGGLPSLLARTPMIDEKGRVQAVIDKDGNLNKLYSFFDPRVYRAYGKFAKELGRYFSTKGISCDVWGMECGQISLDGFVSTIKDYSPVYQQGFSKFISAKKDEDEALVGVMTPDQEYYLAYEFLTTIRSIYADACEVGLSGNWEGIIQVGLLGGSQEDFFKRIHQRESISQYSFDLLESVSLEVLPSSLLLPHRLKKGVLGKMLEQLVTSSFLEYKFAHTSFDEDITSQFSPKRFFEVYDLTPDVSPDISGWADLGLWDYLQKYYSWCYSDMGETEFKWDEEKDSNRIFFFHGITMTKVLFHNILKTFMSGGQVILNRSGLDIEYQRKLEAFFIENDLEVEKVKLGTTLFNASLGDGRFLVFDGDELVDFEQKKAMEFWHKVLATFKVNHLMALAPEGVQVSWKVRGPNTQELSYEEVRRMSIYNPSSYKKKFKFSIPRNFKLIKVIDEEKVHYVHGQNEIEIELLPEGSVSFDFGVFS